MNIKNYFYTLLLAVIPFHCQLLAMNDNRKSGKVIHLSQQEAKIQKELKIAEETWSKLPQSWRAGAKEAAKNVDQKSARLKKLKEINAYQNTQQAMEGKKFGKVLHLSKLESQAKKEYEAAISLDKWTRDNKPGLWEGSEKAVEKELRYKKLKGINEHQKAQQQTSGSIPVKQKPISTSSAFGSALGLASSTAALNRLYETSAIKKEPKDKTDINGQEEFDLHTSSPFKQLKARNKHLEALSEVSENFNDAVSSHDKPMSLDSFLDGLANVTADIVIAGAVGPYTSAVLGACSEAEYLEEKFNELDTKSSDNSITDNWCGMGLGCSYKESVDGLKIVLQAAKKLDRQKRKIIKSHKEMLVQFADFVLEGYKSAQRNYPELFKTKVRRKGKKDSDEDEGLREYMLQQSLAGYTQQQERVITSLKEASHSPQHTLFQCNQEYFIPEDVDKSGKEEVATDTPHMRKERAKLFKKEQEKLNQLFEEYKSEAEYQETMSNIAGGFNGIAAIAGIFGHKKEAYAIRTFGAAGIQAADSIRTIMQKGFAGAGIHPYVGILMAVEGFCEAFLQDDGQDGTQAILDAITQGIMHLSQQLHQLHEDMREQFEEVHKKLNRHHWIVLEKFFALHQDQKNILRNIQDLRNYITDNHRAIQSGLNALHNKVDTNFKMTLDNLNGLRIEEIDELIEQSLLILKRDNVSPEEFDRCIDEFYVKGISRASANALTGGSIDIHSHAALQTVLEGPTALDNIFEDPAFANINLLSRYLEVHFKNFNHEKLVNPLIWIKCVEALMYMLDQKLINDTEYPPTKHARDLDIEKLLILKEHGEKIRKFIEKIGQNNYVEQIAQKHRLCLQQLAHAIQQEQTTYEERVTQELVKEHNALRKREKAHAQTVLSSYECKCAKYLDVFLNPMNTHRRLVNRGYLITPHHRYFKNALDDGRAGMNPPVLPECREIYQLYDGSLKPQDITNPPEWFKQLLQEYGEQRAQLDENFSRTIKVELAPGSFSPLGSGTSWWIYPTDQDHNLPTLLVPVQPLPLNPLYIVAENRGLGAIRHEYTSNGKTFHIQSYFIFKDNNKKIKILDLFKSYTSEAQYDAQENMLHYWYGGRYPKSDDIFNLRYREGATFWATPFPPHTPYPAERDTFVNTAQPGQDQSQEFLPFIQNLIQEDQQQKRLQFNQEIMTHISSRSPTSEIYKAVQEVDASFKILDSLLTLMYNELIHDTKNPLKAQFAIIKHAYCVKNLAVVNKYLQEYSSKHNPEHKQGNYLPFYIQGSSDKLMQAVGEISNANYKPQFNAVTQVMANIDVLVNKYKDKAITPKIRAIKNSPTKLKKQEEPGLLAILLKQNEELIKSNRMLTTKMEAAYQKINSMEEHQQQILALLVAMNNGARTTHALPDSAPARVNSSVRKPVSLYSTKTKPVQWQDAAECGYHALYNALRSLGSTIALQPFLQENKQCIKEQRPTKDDQWLSEDELTALLKRYKTEKMNITVIPDISIYEDGHHGLEYSVLVDLARSQAALNNDQKLYKHTFILGNMSGRTNNTMKHWIAVQQKIEHNAVTYTIMNSLPEYQHDKVETLQNILHNKGNKYNIVPLDPMIEEVFSNYISQLQLHSIFKSKCYARTSGTRATSYRIVNKNLEDIVNDMLTAAEKLLELTNGKSFWSTCGFIKPKRLVDKVLTRIKDHKGDTIFCKNCSDDVKGNTIVLRITREQQQRIARIERAIL